MTDENLGDATKIFPSPSALGEGVGGEGQRDAKTPFAVHNLPFDIEITPEPSPAEHAAILIALQTLLTPTKTDQRPSSSAWAAAGRREALRGLRGGELAGWQPPRDRVAGC